MKCLAMKIGGLRRHLEMETVGEIPYVDIGIDFWCSALNLQL